MDYLDECLCNGQLDEILNFLKMMENFTYIVMSSGSHGTSSITNNTLKELGIDIRNDCLVCPIHNCYINVNHLIKNEKNLKQKKK
jgi:hypothetical protein